MLFLFLKIILSAPVYVQKGNMLEVSGDGEVASSDIKTKTQYDKMEICTILDSITSIGQGAFDGCSCLTSITLPNSLLKILNGAFAGTKIKHIKIPPNVNYIDPSYAFNSYEFTSFEVDQNNIFFSEVDNVLYNKDQTILMSCPTKKTTINFALNVTNIATYAFWSTNVARIEIPDTVCVLNYMSFVDPGSMVSIVFGMGSFLTTIASYSFWGVLCDQIVIPPNVTEIKENAFYYCYFSSFSFMGESKLCYLRDGCFISCTNLLTVSLPKSVQTISPSAFTGCVNLQKISIEDGSDKYKSSPTGSLLSADLKEIVFIPPSATELFIYNETETISSSILQKLTKVPIDAVTIDSNNTFIKYEGGIFYNSDFTIATNALGSVQNAVINSRTKKLSDSMFMGIKGLKSVSFAIGSICTEIGRTCFSDCSNLESVTLPDTISSIGDRAFIRSGITSFTIPRDLSVLPEITFMECTNLATLDYSSGCKLETIGLKCFGGSGLKSVRLPEELSDIQGLGFINTHITEIFFPKKLQKIQQSAFENVPLTNITFAKDIELETISAGAFINCKIEQIILPKSLTTLESTAFKGCSLLSQVEFEADCELKEIPMSAFEGCVLLHEFPIMPSIENVGASSFLGCFNLTQLVIVEPENSHFVFKEGGLYSKNETQLYVFPPGIRTGKVIPDAIEILGNAFYGDSILAELKFDEGSRVQSLGKNTFFGCTSIQSFVLPSSLVNISEGCFGSCTGLLNVTFRDGSLLNEIGSSTFEGCKELTTVNFGTNSQLQIIGENTFKDCTKLQSIIFPSNIKTIGASAFSGCTSLQSVGFQPLSQQDVSIDIPSQCFARCSSLMNAELPSQVRTIGADAFLGCKSLTSIGLQEGLLSLGDRAFMESGLLFADIPSSVSEIGSQAFSYSAGLRSVVVRCQSGLSLKSSCFSLCEKLSNVSFCAIERIEAVGQVFQGSNSVTVFGMISYQGDKVGGLQVLKVMDRCMVFPTAPFTQASKDISQYGLLVASMIDYEGE